MSTTDERDPKKTLFVKIEPALHDQIRSEAKRLDMSTAAFIRLLAMQYFDSVRFERREHAPQPVGAKQ